MASVTGRRTFARRVSLTESQIFLQYYNENDVFFSPEGILKLISIACCVALCAVSLSGGLAACGGAGPAGGTAGGALAVAAVLALLVAARALHLPRKAPRFCLLTDIIVCSGSGVLCGAAGALPLALCRARPVAALYYLHAVLALVTAGLLIASASLTYFSAMRVWDAVAGPRREPRAPPSPDHDV